MKVITRDRRKSSQLKTCLNHCYTKATFYWMFWLRLWANVRVKHWKRRTEDSFVFKKNILYLISVNIAIFVCIPCLKVSSKYLMMTKCPIPVCKTVCDVNKPSCTEWHWRGRMMPDNMTLDRGSYRVFQTLFLNLVVSIFFFRLILILTEVTDSLIFGEPIAGSCGQLMISQNEIIFFLLLRKINKGHLFIQTMPIKHYFHTFAMLKRWILHSVVTVLITNVNPCLNTQNPAGDPLDHEWRHPIDK